MKNIRKSILCLLCWCLCTTLTAQNYALMIDSLEQVLATAKLNNKEKTLLLVKLSDVSRFADTVKCRIYATQALQLAQKSGLKNEEGRAYICLGNLYNIRKSPYLTHAYYMNAEKIFLELQDKERLLAVNRNLMIMFFDIKDYDNVAYYANKVETMAAERDDLNKVLEAQLIHGYALYRNNSGQEALDYYLNLHHKVLHMEDSLGLDRYLSRFVGECCAEIYIKMNRPREALPYWHQQRIFFQSKGLLNSAGVLIYGNLAQAHAMMHHIDSAEYYIQKAMDSPVIEYYLQNVYLSRAKVDSLKGDYLSALANFQKFHQISDSLSKEEKTTEMARIKVWYEFDQKELENTLLQQEYQKQQKMSLRLAIALVAIFALLVLSVFFYRKITEKNREMNELHTVKDKLFSVVAHDLRSPLGALVSILKLANENGLDAKTQALLLKEASSKVNNTFGLLDNLLRWAKSQMKGMAPAPAYFDVQEEIHSVTTALQDVAAAKGITLCNRIEQHQVYADRDMFDVVLRNLITNAIKYTSTEGNIILASELSNDKLVISVKDTGTGMPQEVQEELFKLSKTKSQHGTGNETGTGLGLVLCADFVKANGGNIWFTSVPGEGSTFFFSVPVKN